MNEESKVLEVVPQQIGASGLTITERAIEDAGRQLMLLKQFVQSQMRTDIDYGKIPGTGKETLYKPGAEKLAKMFGLGVRFVDKDKTVDLDRNFAMFSYTAEAYNLKTGVALAQCEGSCNSQEKKYKTRKVSGALEETPITDVMNTLQKMAQKRAYVGAIIQATGASDFYTQDIDSPEEAAALGITAPKRAAVSIPKATSAKSSDQTKDSSPVCCGRPMMISKYPEKDGSTPFYCTTCKTKKARE